MEIRKGMSSPADPRAPSFLTTLLPELRNTVYEVLFKRDDPVLLHNSSVLYSSPSEVDLRRENTAIKTEDISSQLFTHDFQLSTPLLLTCRQVYSETVGILYGQNTFIFSRPLHRHDHIGLAVWHYEDQWERDSDYLPVAYAGAWLTSIGSHFKLLSKVEIDAGAICPHSCPHNAGGLFLLPLLKVLWKHPNFETVKFTWRKPSLSEQASVRSIRHPFDGTSMQKTRVLNVILHALGTDDVLQLKRYSFTNRLISGIYLEQDLTGGHVDFSGTSTACYHDGSLRHFQISRQGGITWIEARERPYELKDLPYEVMSSIFSWTRVYRLKDGNDGLDQLLLKIREERGDDFGTELIPGVGPGP